jgi:TP901 family phage tail tape measure protein
LGIRRVIGDYAKYTEAQSRMRTVLAATFRDTERGRAQFGDLGEAVARDLGFSLTESTLAMEAMLQTGLGVHRSMRVFRTSMELARIGNLDTERSTRFLVDTMRMFNKEMITENENLQEFSRRMSTQLVVSANMASTNITDLQQAFRYAGTELSTLGYTSREVMSSLAGLSVVGLRGTTAGTRLRGAVLALIRPSEQVKKAIDEVMGSTGAWREVVYDSNLQLRRMPDMMAQLMRVMARTTSTQQRHNLEAMIFGRRAFAAGVSMSEMNEAGRTMGRVLRELQGDLGDTWSRMRQERMRSFGMQMTQLKEGVSDLAIAMGQILFGATNQSQEGFGTWVRQVAEAVTLGDTSNRTTAEARRRWQALSPEVRQTATELRETMVALADLIKILARGAVWVAGFIKDWPRLTAALIAVRVAFGGFIPALIATIKYGPKVVAWITGTVAGLTTLIASISSVGLIVEDRLLRWLIPFPDVWKEMDDSVAGSIATWSEYIPVIGGVVATIARLIGFAKQAYEWFTKLQERRRRGREEVELMPTEERITRRVAGVARPGEEEDLTRRRATVWERTDQMQRLATVAYARNIRTVQQMTNFMQNFGYEGEELTRVSRELVGYQQSVGEQLSRDADMMVERRGLLDIWWRRTHTLNSATRDAASALRELDTRIENLGTAAPGVSVMPTGFELPEAGDAFVRRGGVLRVSSGDIVLSRRELASAIIGSRGSMLASPAPQLVAVPPTGAPSGGGISGEVVVPVSVQVDGREVARSVGRAHVGHLERSGGKFAPGVRRQMRETGFPARG